MSGLSDQPLNTNIFYSHSSLILILSYAGYQTHPNKLALELHQLDWLTHLSAFWDQAVSLNECEYFLTSRHQNKLP